MKPPEAPSPFLPLSLPHRARREELIDRPDVDRDLLARSLREVSRVNVWLGGLRSLRHGVLSLSGSERRISLLDVGVGSGALARRLAGELEKRGIRLRWMGLDLSSVALEVARGEDVDVPPGPRLVLGDARALPFPDRSFDVVAATLTLHHLEQEDCVRSLAEMGRVARKGVLVSDLERRPLHYVCARLLALTRWKGDPLTRHDAPLSVLRGFTASELRALAAAANLGAPSVRRYLPFRLLLRTGPGSSAGGSRR